jgi:hypothetical protein
LSHNQTNLVFLSWKLSLLICLGVQMENGMTGFPLASPVPSLTLFTDASLLGWGAYLQMSRESFQDRNRGFPILRRRGPMLEKIKL